ncbi:MAG: hypothetical protein A2Y69_15425, partial [Candidatus Aminicenantes bacterium RBG_13_59_9]
MKRTCLFGLALIILGQLSFSGRDQGQTHDRVMIDRFIAAHVKKASAPPFAFTYGGRPSSEFLAKWASRPESRSSAEGTIETVVYRDPSTKLRVTAVYTLPSDFPAVEWVLRFKNEGTSETALIADVLNCVVEFDDWPAGDSVLYRALGSSAQRSDFAPVRTHFRLKPGEEVRSPSIALLFWKNGDRMAGHNLFRRYVLAHHTPRPQGRPVDLPLSHGVGFGGPFPCNEYICATESYALAMIERLRQFGIDPEACWIDAGWYENSTKSWWSGVGSWFPSRERFPRGLKPVTEAAKKWGKGFVVWFEPERVYEGTWLDREHPEWLTRLPGNPNRLLNLGDPQALGWLTDHISNFLLSEGVTIYRQDFNFDPAPFWQAMDAPDRIGIAEMKHIEGLYAYWDALLARVPGLLIDNCASGGRRIDLETIGRSVPLWRTDYSYFEPNGYQCHTYGLQLFLPCSGTGNNNTQKYHFRSSMGGAVVLGWEINGTYNNALFNLTQAHEDIAEFKSLRPYFFGDFYP